MADSAEQLQRLYLEGFELQTFERYPMCVGVLRDGCIALLRATPTGLQFMGVLVEHDSRQVFQAKSDIVEATPERLELLRRFRGDLEGLLNPAA